MKLARLKEGFNFALNPPHKILTIQDIAKLLHLKSISHDRGLSCLGVIHLTVTQVANSLVSSSR